MGSPVLGSWVGPFEGDRVVGLIVTLRTGATGGRIEGRTLFGA